ncbi:hypothetical protein JWV37_10340 [Sulfurospirillum sp. T05]|uniref:TspB protein n=1 Tax=Sulfurospirillum tamanense TaxID=2813362 RepID=A0ABS2WUA7_9BACT|nr:hypothetical protein [Sulfurospirillum tamanensis]MBN2965180.1 hypothetical protein [Sulfurospirillum tamanensis]
MKRIIALLVLFSSFSFANSFADAFEFETVGACPSFFDLTYAEYVTNVDTNYLYIVSPELVYSQTGNGKTFSKPLSLAHRTDAFQGFGGSELYCFEEEAWNISYNSDDRRWYYNYSTKLYLYSYANEIPADGCDPEIEDEIEGECYPKCVSPTLIRDKNSLQCRAPENACEEGKKNAHFLNNGECLDCSLLEGNAIPKCVCNGLGDTYNNARVVINSVLENWNVYATKCDNFSGEGMQFLVWESPLPPATPDNNTTNPDLANPDPVDINTTIPQPSPPPLVGGNTGGGTSGNGSGNNDTNTTGSSDICNTCPNGYFGREGGRCWSISDPFNVAKTRFCPWTTPTTGTPDGDPDGDPSGTPDGNGTAPDGECESGTWNEGLCVDDEKLDEDKFFSQVMSEYEKFDEAFNEILTLGSGLGTKTVSFVPAGSCAPLQVGVFGQTVKFDYIGPLSTMSPVFKWFAMIGFLLISLKFAFWKV